MIGTRSSRPPEIAGVQLPSGSAFVAGGLALLAGIGAAVGILLSSPVLALTVPLAVAGALICGRFPAAAITVAFLAMGFSGTIEAFVPIIPPNLLADTIIASLWLAVVWAYVSRRRVRRIILWPGLLAPLVYILITAVTIPLSPNFDIALSSFHLSTWYMTLVPLIAFAPWRNLTRTRIARGLILVGILVGCYAAFRYVVGESGSETQVARATSRLPYSVELRFFGSFRTAQHLSAWAAVMLPLGAAAVLAWTGRWRWIALATVGLGAFALLAADVRVGVAAAMAGVALTTVLFLLARAFPVGQRLATGFVSVAAMFALGTAGYVVVTTNSPETVERLEAIFDPTSDPHYRIRLERWEGAWEEIEDEPLGHGLGRSGAAAESGDVLHVGPTPLDNSYLKVGIDQGFPGMVLYIVALAALLLGLIVRTVRTADPHRAALGIAACGSLLAMMVLFYGATYFEAAPVTVPGWAIVGLGAAGFTSFPVTSRRRQPAAAGAPTQPEPAPA